MAQLSLCEFTLADKDNTAEEGILRNVLILGPLSKNGRKYAPSAVADVARLAEGTAVYTDHPTATDRDRKGRSANDRFGKLINVRVTESANGPQARGDLLYLTSHPLSPRVAEDLRRDLHLFGLSILGDGTGRTATDTGETLVESVTRLNEVDLVTGPATATSLREAEEVAYDAPPTETETPAESELHAQDALWSGMRAILTSDASNEEKEAKLKALVIAHMKVHGEEEEEEGEAEGEEKAEEAEEEVKEQATTPPAAPDVQKLIEQAVKPLADELATIKTALAKPRKFTAPAVPDGSVALAEQSNSYPETGDVEAKRRWFRRK